MIFLILILIAASITDLKTRTVPYMIPILAVLIRIVEYIVQSDSLVRDLIYASIIFFILLLGAFMGGVGGADCLIGACIGLYMGQYAVYAILVAVLSSLPQALRKKDKEFPFVPYLFFGTIIALIIWYTKGEVRWY